MQTKITETLDFGVPGEFANTNPRRVYPKVAAADSTVKYGDYDSTNKAIVVTTHQGILRGTTDGALAATLKADETYGLCEMGDVYVKVGGTISVTATGTTADEAKANAKAAFLDMGNVNVSWDSTNGYFKQESTAANVIAKIVGADKQYLEGLTITTSSSGSTTYTGTASATVDMVAIVHIG